MFYGAIASNPAFVATTYQFPPIYAIVILEEGTIPMRAEISTMTSSAITIEKMTQEGALFEVKSRSQKAIEAKDLSIILGSNGESGRMATGNYSLLAKAVGMTRVHVSRVLKGKVQPSHSTLRKLSEATGISLDEISRFIVDHTEKDRAA